LDNLSLELEKKLEKIGIGKKKWNYHWKKIG